MKKSLIVFIGLMFSIGVLYSQCVIKEAIRNGDFDQGYIPGDFDSDLIYAQSDIDGRLAGNQCFYATGGRYYVSHNNQAFSCEGRDHEGTSFTPDFKTYGIDGSSDVLLFVDPLNGNPEVFGQTVNVFPNQTYHFSFWFNSINPPLPFFGATIDGQNVPLTATNNITFNVELSRVRLNPDGTQITDVDGNTLRDTTLVDVQWVQYSGTWTSGANTTVNVELKPYLDAALTQGVPTSGLDFALDKFSLINSCQNVYGANAYVIDFDEPDTVNLCDIGGDVLLDPNVPGGQQNNATITWYEGEGDNPTQIDAGVFTKTISSPGYYTVCVDDPDNACNQVDNIVVIEEVELDITDVQLCSPAIMELDAGMNPNDGVSIDWSGPSGNSSGRTYNASVSGAHSVSINPLKGNAGCAITKNFNVVSLLPETDTIDYCNGGGTPVTLTAKDASSYNWSLNNDMSDLIGTGNSINYNIPNGSSGFIDVWIQNSETSPLGTTVNQATSWEGTGEPQTITVIQPVSLVSVEISLPGWANGSGQTLNFNGENVNFTATGATTVIVNKLLAPGTYTISFAGNMNHVVSPSGSLPGYVDVTGGATGAFKNFKFAASNACDPVPFVLKPIDCCSKPSDDAIIDADASTLEVCEDLTGDVVSVSGLTNGLDFKWQESVDGTTWTDISGEAGDIAGGVITLTPVSTDQQWYRYLIAEDGNIETCAKESDSVQFIINPLPLIDSIGLTPFKSIYCEGEDHVLEAHVDESAGYSVTYEWKLEGNGTDSVFDGITTLGTHNYKVVVDSKGCLDSMEIDVEVEANESADVTDDQGPWCVNDASPTITTEVGTTTGGAWSIQIPDNATIDVSTGELTLIDSGDVRIYYQTPGACFGIDSVGVTIEPAMEVEVLTPDTNFCLSTASFQVRLSTISSAGGTWSCIEEATAVNASGLFDASGLIAGDYTVKYVMNGFNGACSDSDSVVVTINNLDSTEIINLPSLCNSDPAIQLQLNPGLTITGTWSDSLGLVSYVDASGLFDPAGLTDGQVMVIFKTDGACGYSDTAYVTVTSNIEYSMDHITDEYCLNADQDTILVSPGGGTFWTTSGTGIVDADYGYWDPKLYSSDGIDTIWYGKAGACGDTVFIEVTLNPIDLVEIDSAIAVCANEAAFDYTLSGASTTGGTWSGTGITDGVLGTFDPATAGAGIHTIAYQSPNTCLVIDSVHILIKPRVEVSIDSLALPFCGASTALSATGNLHLGLGRWENSASWPAGWDTGKTENDSILTFDPNVVTPGIDSIFYMIDANAFVCGDTATLLIGISPMEVAEIDTVTEVCSSYGPFDYTLSPLSTPNGTWSGVGIVDGLSGTFDPALAGPGIHTIRYKTPGVCFVWDSLTITVVKQEIISLTGGKSYCGNALPGVIDANQAGGVFFGGWDVAALGVVNDSSRTFDPTLAGGTGVDSIFYGIDAQCGDTAWLEIAIDTVDIPDIDGANESAFCQTDNPKVVTLMSTATPGGTWQDFGGGNALITTGGLFDPSIGKGIYQVVYTTPGSCFTTDTHSIEVVSEIIVDVDKTLPDTIFCNNASPYNLTSFLLPTTSGDGSGSWKITPFISGGVVSNNQLVPTALVPGVYSLKYALGSGACSDSDSVSIRILPILDPTIDNEPAADVCVSLKNYQFNNSGDNGGVWSVDPTATIDVVTGDLTLKGGTFEVKYTLGTTCPVDSTVKIVIQEPNNPTIQDPGTICGYDVAFALITTGDTGGTWSGSGVSGTNFDPAVSGEGTFAVNYAFTGTCPIDSTFDFVVDPVLDPTIDNEPVEDICIADGSYAFTTSGDMGGTWSIDNGGVIDASTGVMNLTKGGVFDVTYKHTGCPVEDVVTIEVTTPGNPDFDPAGSFCENLPVYQLSQPLTPGGVWSSLPIAGAVDPVTGEFDPGVAGPGSHDVTYTLEGACPAFDTEIIVIDDLPDWDYVIPNANGCEPYTTSMIVVSQGDLPGTTTWSFTDGLVTTTNGAVDSLTHTFMNDGCYNGTAVVAFENGCIDSVTKTNAVCVNPVPIADFDWGPRNATVLEPFIQFEDLSIDADSWNWDLGRVSTTNIPPNPTASTLQNPFVTYGSPDSGTYTVELIAWNGMCSDTIIKRITILDNFTVFVPNAFTPDGDGLNDIFFPNGKNHDNIEGASEYSFLIFNRWGALIWESGTPYQPWDGTNAKTGSEVQQDVYVWKLKVWDNVESVLKTYYGRVSLIR